MATKSQPNILLFAFHVLMTCMTGGLWLIGLIIWYLMKRN